MKKMRITPNAGSDGRTFFLFDSPEAAYIWHVESMEDPGIIGSIRDVDVIRLSKDEFIEAEWLGCEFSADDNNVPVRIDNSRWIKANKEPRSSGLLVSVHLGWTTDRVLKFKSYSDDDVTVKRLGARDEGAVDMQAVFGDFEDSVAVSS